MIVHVSVIHAFFKMSCSRSVTCESKACFSRMNELEVRLWFSFPSQPQQQAAEGSANNCAALGGSKGYMYLEAAGLDAGVSACNLFLNTLCNKVMVLFPPSSITLFPIYFSYMGVPGCWVFGRHWSREEGLEGMEGR